MPEGPTAIKQVGPFAVVRNRKVVQIIGHERLVAMKEMGSKFKAHAQWVQLSDPVTMLQFMGANRVER